MSRLTATLISGAALCFGLPSARGEALAAPNAEGPQVGSMAPDFTTVDLLTGEEIHLSGQRGKLVIVTFWATWCAPCRRELPILEAAQRLVGSDKLEVLAVNFHDTDEAQAQIKKVLKTYHIAILRDRNSRIAGVYKIRGIPHMYMIDRDGKIIANHLGYGDSSVAELVKDLNEALRSQDVAPDAETPAA